MLIIVVSIIENKNTQFKVTWPSLVIRSMPKILKCIRFKKNLSKLKPLKNSNPNTFSGQQVSGHEVTTLALVCDRVTRGQSLAYKTYTIICTHVVWKSPKQNYPLQKWVL